MLFSFFIHSAIASDIVEVDITKYGQVGVNKPQLSLTINQPLSSLQLQLKCGSFRHQINKSDLGRESIEVELDVAKGKHQCRGNLSIVDSDQGTGEMPINFAVQYFPKMKLDVEKSSVDFERGSILVSADRPLSEARVELIDTQNDVAEQNTILIPQQSNIGSQKLVWSPVSENTEIAILRIVVKDIYGFERSKEFLPWNYSIPHEDVVFNSGSHEIPSSEEYKLADVLDDVRNVVDKYNKFATVNLYIAGYTDTVGPSAANLGLSNRRAMSIAKWFKINGFDGGIYYQGFGESVLQIPTADNVEEAANRRVLYIIASEPPPASTDIPRSTWKLLGK